MGFAFKEILDERSTHLYNMFIMRKPLVDEYCDQIFPILGAVESRVDISSYSEYERRAYGFLGELLLDAWIRSEGLRFTEVGVINTESQHWPKKAASFLGRKLSGGLSS